MTYVLTFTNDTDSYSQNLQLEGIREALLNDCEIHKIDEEISFEKIDDAVEEAIENGCDNFMCLCEDEDVSLLKEGLDSEYGRFFERNQPISAPHKYPQSIYRIGENEIPELPRRSTDNPPKIPETAPILSPHPIPRPRPLFWPSCRMASASGWKA